MKKTQVALVLSGGVSLGSYIAGALDELLRAFEGSGDYEIDVITGASAGATNAALIAHGLLYRNGATDLYDVWVNKIDIVQLLAAQVGPHTSLLSGAVLEKIAKETITWTQLQAPQPAKFCAADLVVAMTLSNATPLPYVSRVHQPSAYGPEEFIQTRSAEQEAFFLSPQMPLQDPIWERIGAVARASAAIPLIFPMVSLARQQYNTRHYLEGSKPLFEGERQFWYYDGGTYNNLPIDLAWYYIQMQQPENPRENRRIIVVNPYRSNPRPITSDPSYPGLLEQVFSLINDLRNESRTVQFDNEVIVRSLQAQGALAPTESLLEALPGVDRPPVELLENFALVIPQKDDPPLRGTFLSSQSAFLDRRFREYDFRRGAADARRVAVELLHITQYQQRPPAFYTPDADPELHVDVSSYAQLERIKSTLHPDRSIRQVFEEALDRRIDALVAHWDVPGPDMITGPALSWLIKKIIHSKLPTLWHSA